MDKVRPYRGPSSHSTDAIDAVTDIVLDPPAVEPYEALKATLLDYFRAPARVRTDRYLGAEPLGGRDIRKFAREIENDMRDLSLGDMPRFCAHSRFWCALSNDINDAHL